MLWIQGLVFGFRVQGLVLLFRVQGLVVGVRCAQNAETRSVVVTEAGSYLRLIDSCITQLQA